MTIRVVSLMVKQDVLFDDPWGAQFQVVMISGPTGTLLPLD
jgi:hypothetical protein